ncbi:MAG: hypothetical protein WAN74_07745 [Thermoplasmata archaeon]
MAAAARLSLTLPLDDEEVAPTIGSIDPARIPRFLALTGTPVLTLAGKARCPVGGCRRWLKSRPAGLRHLHDDHGWIYELKEVRNALAIEEPRALLTPEQVRERQRATWKDPTFRARNAAASRKMLADRWKDPTFRARHAAAVRSGQLRRWAKARSK